MIKMMVFGDVVGRSGRDAVIKQLPQLRKHLDLDFVVLNGENAAHGFGITPEICKSFYAAGVDVITTGNHIWDQKQIIPAIGPDSRLVRPLNYPLTSPGRGMTLQKDAKGRTIAVMNVMGRLFMDPLDDPFAAVEKELKSLNLGGNVAAIIVDIHAEANSEKMAMAHVCDGRVSLVFGTHTHIPTADNHILPNGTAYISDLGMCGDYNSVIGMKKESPISRFTKKMPTEKMSPAEGPGTICALYVELDDKSGKALYTSPVRIGPVLQPSWPDKYPTL
jgi:metallophosphoesterase (TIGR00282 family)